MKRIVTVTLFALALMGLQGVAMAAVKSAPKAMSEESKQCIACHKQSTPAAYQQWGESKHYGANVGCFECHKAGLLDSDGFKHNGKRISISNRTCFTQNRPSSPAQWKNQPWTGKTAL